MRASELGYSRSEEVTMKLKMIFGHWKDATDNIGGMKYLEEDEVAKRFNAERGEAEKWLRAFAKEEAAAVAKGLFPSLEETEKAMDLPKFHPDYNEDSDFQQFFRKTTKKPMFLFWLTMVVLAVSFYFIKKRTKSDFC